jgi:hypothetical protein
MFLLRRGQRIEVPDDYVVQDGEAITVPVQLMDDDGIVDAFGGPAGYRRGYAFDAAAATARRAALDAYEERSRWLEDAWRKKDQELADPPRTQADAQAAAAAAYDAKCQRLRDGWKEGRHA